METSSLPSDLPHPPALSRRRYPTVPAWGSSLRATCSYPKDVCCGSSKDTKRQLKNKSLGKYTAGNFSILREEITRQQPG